MFQKKEFCRCAKADLSSYPNLACSQTSHAVGARQGAVSTGLLRTTVYKKPPTVLSISDYKRFGFVRGN